MAKVVVVLIFLVRALLWPSPVKAAEINSVTPVFVVRSREFWRQGGDPKYLDSLIGDVEAESLSSTWLLQADALDDPLVIQKLKSLTTPAEFGIFLEISQKQAEGAMVAYPWYLGQWTAANRLFTSGYDRPQRLKLIAAVFEKFKSIFGQYPQAVGAWHIDGWTLEQLRERYGVQIMLGLADQYSTDGYQVWGQYVNQPYYASAFDPLEPATDQGTVLKVLWAPRHQAQTYSRTQHDSNFSVQVNDYHRAKQLPFSFFTDLLAELTVNIDLPLAQAVIGIEVAELEPQYHSALVEQLHYLSTAPEYKLQTLAEFNQLYRQTYPGQSPSVLLKSTTGNIRQWWFMSPYYRLGVELADDRLSIIDLRYYQTLPVADNDQLWPDKRENLYRVVPAVLDRVSLGTSQIIGSGPVSLNRENDYWQINFQQGKLILNSKRPGITGVNPHDLANLHYDSLMWNGPELLLKSPQFSLPQSRCFGNAGYYQPPFPCLKAGIIDLLAKLPDFRYSKLGRQHFLGWRTGEETFVGVAFLPLRLGEMSLPFSVLEYFLSSRKFIPQFSWLGRQELSLSLSGFASGQDKGGSYGQDEILKQAGDDKLFENGYYLVPR